MRRKMFQIEAHVSNEARAMSWINLFRRKSARVQIVEVISQVPHEIARCGAFELRQTYQTETETETEAGPQRSCTEPKEAI